MRITLSTALLFVLLGLSAQRYTYLGGEIGLISARLQLEDNPLGLKQDLLVDGGFYGLYLRQEFTRVISLQVGYSWNNYEHSYIFPGGHFAMTGGLYSHQIPISVDFDVNVYKDRISVYTSFGYLFSVKQAIGWGSNSPCNLDGDSLVLEWNYIAESEHSSRYNVGIGSRFRVVDEFLAELELGYVFGFNDLREYVFTYWDHSGNMQTQSATGQGNYWVLRFGFSYPIQKAIRLVKKGVSQMY